jgi:hypothetical protein
MLDVEIIAGDLPERTRIITGNDVVLQRLSRRLQTHLGEFLADKTVGVPWADWLAVRRFDIDTATAWLRASIETCPGVVRLDDWVGVRDGDTATFTGTVVVSDGSAALTVTNMGDPGSGNTSGSFRLVLVR